MMMSKFNDDSIYMVKELGDASVTKKKVDAIPIGNPMEVFRSDILNFFKDRISAIASQELIKNKVEQALLEKLESDELDFDQLMHLYSSVSKTSLTSVESIMSLFKPVPGAPSILADKVVESEGVEDKYKDIYDSMSPKELEKLDKLFKLLQKVDRDADV